MNIKTLLLLVVAVLVAFVLGFGGIWFYLGGNQSQAPEKKPHAEKHDKEATLTGTMDLFQLTLPCKRNAQGDTPVVHADFQLVVPLQQRMKVEEKASRIRDIIASLLRNSDVDAINADNLVGFKNEIIRQTREALGVNIQEVLILRFDYDIMKQRH